VTRVGVLGAGSWGTTLADLLVRRGHEVGLWAFEPEVAAAVNRDHENPVFLPGARLDPALRATANPAEAVGGAACVVIASPSHVTRSVVTHAGAAIPGDAVIVSATKGIETPSLALMSEVVRESLPTGRHFVALSGPSFAKEVYQRQPTAVVAASVDSAAARFAQDLFATSYFRVYSNDDVIGTELAGSLKNTIAIAAGILEGLGLGNNPRAALITRGLAEMTRLGIAMGADPRTFAGLAGMGDLILTCCGALSRNRALGLELAAGTSLVTHLRTHRTVAEGVNTARAAVRLGVRHGVELPIAEKISEILFEGKPPQQAVGELMDRTLKPEL
jgi:glycerol-3-phosphate dehydrogenase (NAD(P)+)